jgi:predicted GNAT superfamily acetyltransferase
MSAAHRAGVEVHEIAQIDHLREASAIYASIWSMRGDEGPMPGNLLRAFVQSGNYVAGAFSNGRIVGALTGFLGEDQGKIHLHSHILGVSAELQGRSVGFALKEHQRAWALQRGIDTVAWTFDPLVARNAYFNLTKLGADASEYFANFYGEMNDGINAGDESDRILIEWKITSPKAVAASLGDKSQELDLSTSGAAVLEEDEDGRPATRGFDGAPVVACRVPSDIMAIRDRSPDLAREWRMALRHSLGAAMGSGYRVVQVSRSGYYFLARED